MALYLYEGDSFNAALAAAALIPGGAMLAIGVGKGARALFNLARSGAKDLGAAVKASRLFRGLAGGARAVSRVVGSVRTRISRWIGKADDLASHADDVDSWRVPGSVPETGRTIRSPSLQELVPAYTSGKVRGVMDTGSDLRPVLSGRKGPAASMPLGSRGFNGITKTHVEGHAAAIMHQETIADATLFLNKRPCPDPTGCYNMLPRMIPPGGRLRVIAPSGFDMFFYGLPG